MTDIMKTFRTFAKGLFLYSMIVFFILYRFGSIPLEYGGLGTVVGMAGYTYFKLAEVEDQKQDKPDYGKFGVE